MVIDQPTPFESSASTGLPTSGSAQVALSPLRSAQSNALYQALLVEDARLALPGASMAQMYLGAMAARYQIDNPESLVQSAHSLRELMEKMPRFLGIAPVASQGLTVRTREIVTAWQNIELVGDSDEDLRTRLLDKFHKIFAPFATWFTERDAPKKEQAGQMLEKIDQRKMRLPRAIEKHRVDEWSEYEGYFMEVCHHRSTTRDEFDAHVAGLEDFVLGYLRPRTFDDRAAAPHQETTHD